MKYSGYTQTVTRVCHLLSSWVVWVWIFTHYESTWLISHIMSQLDSFHTFWVNVTFFSYKPSTKKMSQRDPDSHIWLNIYLFLSQRVTQCTGNRVNSTHLLSQWQSASQTYTLSRYGRPSVYWPWTIFHHYISDYSILTHTRYFSGLFTTLTDPRHHPHDRDNARAGVGRPCFDLKYSTFQASDHHISTINIRQK